MDAILYVIDVKICLTITIHHAKNLSSWRLTQYPLRRDIVISFAIGVGSLSVLKENPVSEQLPRRLILGFVKHILRLMAATTLQPQLLNISVERGRNITTAFGRA